jgi:sodium/hydrogen antiporter
MLCGTGVYLLPVIDPVGDRLLNEHVTETVVIISLMGAGLALNRPVGWRRWGWLVGGAYGVFELVGP